MRLSKVTGMPVVDTHVARQAGVVSDVLLDVQSGRIAVLNVKHADGWLVQRIPAEYVYRLGPHTVLVADTVAVDLGPPAPDQRWFPIESLVGRIEIDAQDAGVSVLLRSLDRRRLSTALLRPFPDDVVTGGLLGFAGL